MYRLLILASTISFFFLSGCQNNDNSYNRIDDSTRKKTIDYLRQSVDNQSEWVKIHAAEFLIDLGYTEKLYSVFEQENYEFETVPRYRIGVWRVLYQLANKEEKKEWLDKIVEVYKDTLANDREHAVETLAKLNISANIAGEETVKTALRSDNQSLVVFTLWSLATSSEKRYKDELLSIVKSDKMAARPRKLAAYALRHLKGLDDTQWKTLADYAVSENEFSENAVYILSAAYVNTPDDSLFTETFRGVKQELVTEARKGPTAIKELSQAIADRGLSDGFKMLKDLESLVKESAILSSDVDLQINLDYALLKLDRKQEKSLSVLDWLVIAFYLGGMLWIGWYYSRKNKTSEDYLLGGRKMNPVTVGISLFATLLSTLSYLSYPGEMINHGPVIFTGMLAFPLVYYVVGWWVIPHIMKVNVTSAYEILETRFGLKVRMMAVTFFLCLRMLWMASIMYVTIDVALFSVIPLDRSLAPIIGIVLLLITIIYTSMGGIKAVVITDVVQSGVFIGGAFLCIIVTCLAYNSFTNWLPDHWLGHWSTPKIGFDTTERLTVGNAILTLFLWYICTSGGDQTAIQRYLSTRDIKAARKTLRVSLFTNLVAKGLLALVGLSVMAYFMKNVHLLEYGKTIEERADALFPRFILVGLPSGLSGLMIAALFAAAMSSLSSGLNSVSTVVSEDIIKRFDFNFFRKLSELQKIKILSYFIGIVVMILSLFVGKVDGNLIDVINKVVNLFVAPLFVLFFMAFFIPFATSNSTFIGGIVSILTGIAIAFFGAFGITVLWILPMSLFSGVISATILSFVESKTVSDDSDNGLG